MSNIKTEVLSLLDAYYENVEKREECIDKLYILVYYHRTSFGLSMTDDEVSDFLSGLYPAFIEKLFSRHDASKANFYTFVCACLKYKGDFFLQNTLKERSKLNILIEQAKSDALLENELLENDIQNHQIEKSYNLYVETREHEINEGKDQNESKNQDQKMKKSLLDWFNNEGKKGNKKGERRLVFILICKAASFIDDQMLKEISKYLEISFELVSYYVDIFRCEFIKCNKEMLAAKGRRDKYFVKRLNSQRMLELENNTEYGKRIIQRSLEYSNKKFKSASEEINRKLKNVSNRRISAIMGISRSCIDRICSGSKNRLGKLN